MNESGTQKIVFFDKNKLDKIIKEIWELKDLNKQDLEKKEDFENQKIKNIVVGQRHFKLKYELFNLNTSDTFYVCEDCLESFDQLSVYTRHLEKCRKYILSSIMVYKENGLVIWKVRGYDNISACQNLCIIGKAFIRNKTLFWDIEDYHFYIACDNNKLVGYFSEEIFNEDNNLSCISILPDCQKRGYGSLLVDLSYFYKKGTCERPLSKVGERLYEKYWKSKVLDYLIKNNGISKSIEDMSNELNMNNKDLNQTFNLLHIKIEKYLHIKVNNPITTKLINQKYIL